MIIITKAIRKDDFKRHNSVTQAIRVSGARVSSFCNAQTMCYYTIEFESDSSYEAYCNYIRTVTMNIKESYRKPNLKMRVRSLFRYLFG